MANPYFDTATAIGPPLHWYRWHDATAGTENDVGSDPDTDFVSASGTYTARQTGPLDPPETTYSLNLADAYLGRGNISSNDFASTTAGTVTFFFKSTYSAATQIIMGAHPDTHAWLFLMTTSGAMQYQAINASDSTTITSTLTGLNDGNFHLFGLSCDGTNANRMFIDGNEVTLTTSLGGSGLGNHPWLSGAGTTNDPFRLGNSTRAPTLSNLPFFGNISELSFWAGALSATDHADLWAASQPPIPPTPGAGGHRYRGRRTFAGF